MKTGKIWIGTSWKMNKSLSEALAFTDGLKQSGLAADARLQLFVIPSFTAVREVKVALQSRPILVGAQNMHWCDHGAWTGEVSPIMLKDCSLDIVELGHSERREYFGETDETIGLKVEAAVRHGLIPLICIGETLADRQAGRASEVLAFQVSTSLSKLSDSQKSSAVLFAYEPVWAIGENGIPATPSYADARHAEIIALSQEILGHRVPCLYGGSVNRENCAELMAQPNIDGLFIGRSAWQVEGYIAIINSVVEAL